MGHPSKNGQQRFEITVLEFSECSGLEKDNWELVVEGMQDLYIKGKIKSDDQRRSLGNMII